MAWWVYDLTYRALTPILLGRHPLGFIQRTRYFIPGWTLWGAITARLTHALLPQARGRDYKEVGAFVAANLRTSYAYIRIDGEPAYPRYKEGKLHYGPLAAAEFEARFLTSRGQTAIAPGPLTAFTAALYETETIAAYDRSGDPVHWRFKLYMRDPWKGLPECLNGLSSEKILEAVKELSVGGDRHYGLGRLGLEDEPIEPEELGGEVGPRPQEWDSRKRVLLAHVPLEKLSGDAVRGRAEPIPWRWWQNEPGGAWGPGQQSQVRLFYTPGSQVELESWRPVVGPMGIWLSKGGATGDPMATS